MLFCFVFLRLNAQVYQNTLRKSSRPITWTMVSRYEMCRYCISSFCVVRLLVWVCEKKWMTNRRRHRQDKEWLSSLLLFSLLNIHNLKPLQYLNITRNLNCKCSVWFIINIKENMIIKDTGLPTKIHTFAFLSGFQIKNNSTIQKVRGNYYYYYFLK